MPQLNREVGKKLTSRLPPKFAGFVVVGGTWQPTNLLKNDVTENEEEEPFNYNFYAPGEEVSCQLVQEVTDPPTADLQPSMVIEEVVTVSNPAPGKWLVLKADPRRYGKRALMFDCTLRRHAALDLEQETPA